MARGQLKRALPAAKASKYKPRPTGGNFKFAPTDEQRKMVESGIAVGLPQDIIAKQIGIDQSTLSRHFADEIAFASSRANGSVVRNLFNLTKSHPVACFYWLGNRDPDNWKNVNRIEGSITVRNEMPDLSRCSEEDLAVLKAAAEVVERASRPPALIEGDATETDSET